MRDRAANGVVMPVRSDGAATGGLDGGLGRAAGLAGGAAEMRNYGDAAREQWTRKATAASSSSSLFQFILFVFFFALGTEAVAAATSPLTISSPFRFAPAMRLSYTLPLGHVCRPAYRSMTTLRVTESAQRLTTRCVLDGPPRVLESSSCGWMGCQVWMAWST